MRLHEGEALRPKVGDGMALECKREILTMPLTDPDDMSPESHRTRALVLTAADSTIEQTICVS
jgi:hypothetical protein